jgi:hypothetical protein
MFSLDDLSIVGNSITGKDFSLVGGAELIRYDELGCRIPCEFQGCGF